MRRRLIVAAALLLALAAVDALVWRWAVGRVEQEALIWANLRRAEGWTVTLGPPEAEGWPLAARIRLRGARLQAPRGGPALTSAETAISVGLLHPQLLSIALEGQQQLDISGSNILFDADRLVISVPLALNQDPDHADISAANLRLRAPSDAAAIAVEQGSIHLSFEPAMPRGTLGVTGQIGPVALPPNTPLAALGPKIDTTALQATMSPDRIELARFDITWGKVSAAAHATLSPDARRQPSGTGEARITGTSEAIDALVAGRVLAPRPAAAAKALLGLLQRPQPNGPPIVVLPLSLQDRVLQIGPYPIAKLPDTTW